MIRLSLRLLAAAALLPAARAAGQQLPPATFSEPDHAAKLAQAYPAIDSLFTAMAAREHIPGAAWGIVIDGKLAHVSAAGVRDIATKAPVDTNSVFRIASMTKSFTAASILLLRDEGKLSLDDPAEKWVPELKGLRPTTDSPVLTIRLLLSHDTGWPEDNPWGDQQLSIADSTLSRMIKQGIPFSHAPNTGYEYSNYAFMILGRIVARASGMPYAKFVQTRLLTPLGMKSSTLEVGTVPKNQLALGYRWEDNTWKLEPQLPDGAGGPMGGLLTSPHDMGVWVSTMLAAWPPRDGPETGPVRRGSLREMQQTHRTRPPLVTYDTLTKHVTLFSAGYGFGLRIMADCRFAHIVTHAGGLPGFGSLMVWLPEYGVGLFAFGNRTYTNYSAASDSVFALLARTGGLERRLQQPAPALVKARDQVTRLVIKWNDALADSIAAMNLYLDHSKGHRIAQLDSLHAKVGTCQAASQWFFVENALRGEWIMPCEHGAIWAGITMAPTMPPKVQFLDVVEESASMANAKRHAAEMNCRN